MSSGLFSFDGFVLDPGNRRLMRGDVPVELNSRYFDALALLVREQGQLVSKERFLAETWRGVPVTDESITQCIKMLRQQLGDKAASPSFIETVPKHGYRFIAPVTRTPGNDNSFSKGGAGDDRRQFLAYATAGTMGGGAAGVVGGLVYGFAAASQTVQPGAGAISILLVVVCITTLIAVMGGAGVGVGMAVAGSLFGRSWASITLGGALGGLLVGALAKLLGIDAFNLLLGNSPGDITGAAEGAVLGGAVGLGVWLMSRAARRPALGRGVFAAGLAGAAAGTIIVLAGGRLMVGSLDLLVRQFASSRLRLDPFGRFLGESDFGYITQVVTGGLEGALFALCIASATILVERRLTGSS